MLLRIPNYLFVALILFTSCGKKDPAPTRTFRMGFQNSAPRYDDLNLIKSALRMWVEPGDVADAAMITREVPWANLLAGQSAGAFVNDNYKGLVDYYRQHNLELWVYIDPENGLNRSSDSQPLAAAGKSIADDDAQKIYREFVIAMDSILKPEHIGLALETNLIRLLAPSSIYNGVKKAANDAANDLKARQTKATLSVSIQADVAWGSLQGTFQYIGIAQDLSDFSFANEFGISSYPYFAYPDPKDIPPDYYSKIRDDISKPVFVSEGGWSSQTIAGPNNNQLQGSEQKQSDYILKQSDMLNAANATAVFSLTFTDIDLSAVPAGVDPSIGYFAYLGVVDKDLKSKKAFESWKKVFARSRQ